MPTLELTTRFCDHALAAPGQAQTDYYDDAKKYPGLILRVSARRKAWTYLFQWNGDRVRWTFGTYPATSLAKAHEIFYAARTELAAGHDPRTALAKPETLKAICEDWAERQGGRSVANRKATLVRLVYPALGDLPFSDIRRSDIVRMLDQIEDEHGPSMADKTLSILSRVFNFHASRSDDFRSPIVRGMARTKPIERARTRALTDDELRMVWTTAETQGAFGHLVRFILLTSARRSEAAAMSWAELDLSSSEAGGKAVDWTLPGARNKTGRDLIRPLPISIMAQLPDRGPGPFVFSTDGGVTSLSGYAKFKQEFDEATGPLPNWTLHDLRRTSRSLLSRAGVSADHAERVLGHVIGGIRATYDRHAYHAEKADALAKLARLIGSIVSPRPKVLTLHRVPKSEQNQSR
jgi:integrase